MLNAWAHVNIYVWTAAADGHWMKSWKLKTIFTIRIFLNATREQQAKPHCNFWCKNTCVGMQIVFEAIITKTKGIEGDLIFSRSQDTLSIK